MNGKEAVVRILLRYRSNPRQKFGEFDTGKALIHEAAKRGWPRCVENLVELGEEEVDRRSRNKRWTPLMFACWKATAQITPNPSKEEDFPDLVALDKMERT